MMVVPQWTPAIVPQNRLLQIVHTLGHGERPRAARAIALGIEPLGACHGRIERCLRPPFCPLDRGGRRLAIKLSANRLRRHRSSARVSGGLPHGLSNCAILLLQGPACADAAPRAKAAPTTKAAINRRFMIALRLAARLAARHAKRRVARRCQSSSAGAL